MLVRIVHGLPGTVGLTALAYLTGVWHGGVATGVATALIVALVAIVIVISAADRRGAVRRQLQFAAGLFALHAAALYTFATGDSGAPLSAGVQGLIAVLAALACAGFAARMPAPEPPRRMPAAAGEDPDRTLELPLDDAHVRSQVIEAPQAAPPLRAAFVMGIAGCALLVLATLFWLGDEVPRDSLGAAAAREVVQPPAATASEEPAVSGSADTEVPLLADSTPPENIETPVVPEPAPEPTAPTVAPSAARRECMAQIETARLFLQFARDAVDEQQYGRATSEHIARSLASRPVGPRTLARIAERMWERRAEPDRDPAWWSGQYSRCEQVRSGGSWYVVRG
jgi:hypothetical protein